jgi:hypothetical protein
MPCKIDTSVLTLLNLWVYMIPGPNDLEHCKNFQHTKMHNDFLQEKYFLLLWKNTTYVANFNASVVVVVNSAIGGGGMFTYCR